MTHYPDNDKPIRLFTAYRCPKCSKQINVRNSKGETLEDVWRLHRMHCRVRVEQDGGDICRHLGRVTGESVRIGGCGGGQVALFRCSLHKICLPYTSKSRMSRAERKVPFCAGCSDYEAIAFKNSDLCGDEVTRRISRRLGSAMDPGPVRTSSNTPQEDPHEAE